MKIDSKDKKIKDIFKGKEYKIPDYQRNYSWDINEEIDIFWEDFLYYFNNQEEPNFFIGTFVFTGEGGVDSTSLEVIDGQQRLITISIFINVLIHFFEENKEQKLAEGLKNFLIFKDVNSNEKVVIDTEDPHPYYQKLIFNFDDSGKPTKTSEKLILRVRNFFINKIGEELKILDEKSRIKLLKNMRDHLLNIDTVIIVSDKQYDAYTIFETINTRGKSLSSLDLLKNHIFKTYPKKPGVEEYKLIWKSIQGNLREKELEGDKFFNRFWSSHVSKVTETKLYRRFYDYIKSKKNKFKTTKKLLNSLYNASEIYKKILSPSIDDWKKNKNIEVYYSCKHLVGHFNVKVVIPFLLALIEEFQNKKINRVVFLNTLLALENFHFIFSHIVSPRASGLDGKYSKFAIRLRTETNKKSVIVDLLKDLKEKLPTLSEYQEKFYELDYLKNKDTVKYILLRLERDNGSSSLIDLEENSIDHLYPRSSKLSNRHNIGNLFLLEEVLNREKDNHKPFDEIIISKGNKKSVIDLLRSKTKYQISKEEFKKILYKKTWNKKDIDDRKENLSRSTYKLFSKVGL